MKPVLSAMLVSQTICPNAGVPNAIRVSWNRFTSSWESGRPAVSLPTESSATAVTAVVPAMMPIRDPSETDASLMAAAVPGSPRGVLAKTIAVRTVVETTNPAPMKTRGT